MDCWKMALLLVMGLSTSVDRLRSSKSKSKVIILLTDGENNGGLIGPDNAKEIAKAFGIKVYTIGVGTDGYAPVLKLQHMGVISAAAKSIPLMKNCLQLLLVKPVVNISGQKIMQALKIFTRKLTSLKNQK